MKSFSEFIDEGTPTENSTGAKFEAEVADGVKQWLSDVGYPFTVSRPEEDMKFYSDVCISNGESNVWIEAKANDAANLGCPSFKYQDGEWSCTTTDGAVADYMLDILKENSGEFIDFARDVLGREPELPADLPDIMDAWTETHSFDSGTKEGKLYLFDAVKIDKLGEKVTKFYQTAKREPAYYIQVADDLYILDKRWNPLNLKTKDGKDLLQFKDVFRSGTAWFRAKGGYKTSVDKYYYSIVVDVKADHSELPELNNYACSFTDREKWPTSKNPYEV